MQSIISQHVKSGCRLWLGHIQTARAGWECCVCLGHLIPCKCSGRVITQSNDNVELLEHRAVPGQPPVAPLLLYEGQAASAAVACAEGGQVALLNTVSCVFAVGSADHSAVSVSTA